MSDIPEEYLAQYMKDKEVRERREACLKEIQDVLAKYNCQLIAAAVITTEGTAFNIDVRAL